VLLFILSFGIGVSLAQDSLKIMYYNLLNYPDASPERSDTLRKIVQYVSPDVFVVNELMTEVGADLILNESLNQFGTSTFQRAAFVDGTDTDNMLFYNSDKLGLVTQTQIETSLRDFSEYVLYYKSPGLNASSDTVYLHFYSAHLKAGAGDFAQRADEAQILKNYLNSRTGLENVFVGGDFNFYSGNEEGCYILRTSGSVELFDPLDEIGDWSANWVYADLHTQSTRMSSFGDGSGGGMDDRFDLIFVSDDVLSNENGVAYIEDSYWALGQDGGRYNQSIISPTNFSVPDSVSQALYWMSDHLPVVMDVELDYTASVESLINPESLIHQKGNQLIFDEQLVGTNLLVFDTQGRKVRDTRISFTTFTLELPTGYYLMIVPLEDELVRKKIFVHE